MFLRNLRPFVLTVIVALSIASCSLFDDVTYVVTPNPLEAHGDSVKVRLLELFQKKVSIKALSLT